MDFVSCSISNYFVLVYRRENIRYQVLRMIVMGVVESIKKYYEGVCEKYVSLYGKKEAATSSGRLSIKQLLVMLLLLYFFH